VTAAYTTYAAVVLPLAFRANPRRAALFLAAGVGFWTLLEYLVHRHILHGIFPDGKSWLRHRLHRYFDASHGDHHMRPWDGMYINGRFDTVPFALVLAGLSFLAPLPTAPTFIAAILLCYVIEEWVHYSVHYHTFRSRYFTYIRKHHMFHHGARGGNVAFGLTNGMWDILLDTRISDQDRQKLYGRRTAPAAPSPR
jgi:sterol desaturase/sphingolipid hydroxylase (fatty acid hydroxylase superfamily)